MGGLENPPHSFRLSLQFNDDQLSPGQGFTLIYQDADHYWPMKNISDNTSSDTISYMHADLMNHDGKLNNTKLFGPAVILDGVDDWIKLGL